MGIPLLVPELYIFLMVFLVLRGYQNVVFMVLSFHISDGISILGDEESLFFGIHCIPFDGIHGDRGVEDCLLLNLIAMVLSWYTF